MELLTAEQMRNVDKRAIEGMGIPSLELMENAGAAVADELMNLFTDFVDLSVLIICGKGNNGGDGFVVARYLEEEGVAVQCYLLGKPEELKGDAAANYNRAIGVGIKVTSIEDIADFFVQSDVDVIVDSIFGTGFHGGIRGIAAEVVERMNGLGIPVLAVDCPSGLNSTTGEVSKPCIYADYTVTLARPKVGLYIFPGREYAGEVSIVDIGIPSEAVEQEDIDLYLSTPDFLQENLPERMPQGYKGTFGYLYVLAGSVGLTGSACLTAESALRAGCGMVRMGVPASLNPIFEIKLTEVMTSPLPEVDKRGCLALRGLGEIRKDIKDWANAVAIGPGIGTNHETRELIRRLVPSIEVPMVIDADGLNNLAGADEVFKQLKAPCVLTPHPGELSRLMEEPIETLTIDRFKTLREAARKFDCVIVFKGAPMLVGEPSGTIYVSPTGNSGMGTAGTGDVLTGIIGSFLAQGMNVFEAAICGVYAVGQAGDLALEFTGNRGMIAGDIRDNISEALLDYE
ncbi:MAG: NAD(P)H-hydrate dehydratase [candidate division Zixibacteria bacterium]|nr:NAD(P)H-hydrate dehydratase [candidate division Zixibacteria bacterium]